MPPSCWEGLLGARQHGDDGNWPGNYTNCCWWWWTRGSMGVRERDTGRGWGRETGGGEQGEGGKVADDRFICMQRGPRVIGMKGPATGASLPRPTAPVPPSGPPLFCPTPRPCHQGPASRPASTRGCVTHRFTQVANSYSPPPGKGQTTWTAGCL